MSKTRKELIDWPVTTLDILRHGKPEGGEIFRGSTDVPIGGIGLEQMHASVKKLKVQDRSDYSKPLSVYTTILTSPLRRCQSFAEEIAEAENKALNIHSGLREICFGVWDGLSIESVKQDSPEAFNNYWRDPTACCPPEAEPFDQFSIRVTEALEDIIQTYRGEHCLLVTHGGVVRAILNRVLGGNASSFMRYEVPYACISRIRVYHDDDQDHYQLFFHNR